MRLLLVVLVAGAGVGYLRSGTIFNPFRIRWVWLPLLGALTQASFGLTALRHAAGPTRPWFVLGADLLVGAWIVAGLGGRTPGARWGVRAIRVGWLANLAAMVANGGMPVSRSALRAIGAGNAAVTRGNLWKHVPAGAHSTLGWLGDVIAVPALRNVLSVGDLLIALGVLVALATLPRTGRVIDPAVAAEVTRPGTGGELVGSGVQGRAA